MHLTCVSFSWITLCFSDMCDLLPCLSGAMAALTTKRECSRLHHLTKRVADNPAGPPKQARNTETGSAAQTMQISNHALIHSSMPYTCNTYL